MRWPFGYFATCAALPPLPPAPFPPQGTFTAANRWWVMKSPLPAIRKGRVMNGIIYLVGLVVVVLAVLSFVGLR